MPNRILKESVCTSDTIAKLTWFEEVLFYRLIVNCDDYGRFDGRPQIVKNRLFPLKEALTTRNVGEAINKLASVGLVVLYKFEDKPFLFIPTWDCHQTVRAKRSRYPAPDDCVIASASICKQMQADVPVIQSNPYPNPYPNTDSTERQAASMPPVAFLPLNDGTEYGITQDDIDHWKELYPSVDVEQEIRNMIGWLEGNKSRRKTRRGITAFITSWLSKEQDRGRAAKTQRSGMDYLRDMMEAEQ